MVTIADNENVKKGVTFLFVNLGLFISAGIILTKIDVMAKKVDSQTQELSADIAWQSYLYHKTVLNILNTESPPKE